MNQLLIKRALNHQVTKQEFCKDIECLFEVLRDSYGLY